MAKILKPRDIQNKLIENIRRQYNGLFSKRDELPTPMGLHEVEALQARIIELESEVALQSGIKGSGSNSRPQKAIQPLPVAHTGNSTKQAPNVDDPQLEQLQRSRNAFRNAVAIAALAALSLPVYAFAIWQTGAWQLVVIALGALATSIISVISAVVARRNRPSLATTLMIAATALFPVVVAMINGLGLVFSVMLFMAVIVMVGQTLPRKEIIPALLVGLLGAVLTFLGDRVVPWERLSFPILQTVVPIIAVTGILILGTVAFRPTWEAILLNLSTSRKIALIVSILVLGIFGVLGVSIANLGTLQYHLSNMYEFMLVPITAISESETALAKNQFIVEQSYEDELSPAEIEQNIKDLQQNTRLVAGVIDQYQTEWVTSVSPEFTQILQSAGQIDLQTQEVNILNELITSFAEYRDAEKNFTDALQAGQKNEALAHGAIEKLQTTMDHLHTLVIINNQFARISNQAAGAAYGQGGINMGMMVVVVLILGLAFGFFVTTSLTSRLGELVHGAAEVQQGNFDQTPMVRGNDEVGLLGRTFNDMAAQLANLFGEMEQRVSDRTHDIELATDVGRTINEKIANLPDLLSKAVELIRERFGLYYTQVYLTDAAGRNLVLRAGTGDAGLQLLRRGHRLAISPGSLNGRAVSERQPVLVTDTQASSHFLPNPLLPLTRSELSIPLIVSNNVVGVLDMQSEKAETFNESNLPAYQLLAGQLATAIQNAALLEETNHARLKLEAQAARMSSAGWLDYLNALQRSEKIGFIYRQNEILPLVETEISTPENALAVPIQIGGANIGEIQLADTADRKWTEAETEVVQATVENIARHIENLRLLAQAESYRVEAENASQRLTREGWENYLKARKQLASGYVYDQNQVQPLKGNGGQLTATAALSSPIVVHEETIGELVVHKENGVDGSAQDFVTAVAQQLSDHIENLRLLEETEQKRQEAQNLSDELIARATQLETVAALSTTASTVLDPETLLQAIVDLAKERFGLYHAHIYLVDVGWETLVLASGAGTVGRQMVADEHSIAINAQQSLVARAAREQKAVTSNNVRKEEGFLPNPLLPNTRSEMAVPLIVGDSVLGVFDVQSDRLDGFSKEDADIYTTLAAQVAVALQNARLYAEQAATVSQLRELDRLKSSFLANMSHELRTPLNSILGFSDVMLAELDGPLTENMTTDLGLIHKNGQHLLHLINDVLDMAKIDAGRMNLNPEKFRLHETLDEVTSITSTLASEKNLSLFIDKNSDQKLEIYADRTRIRQVMINLVNNAIKFTEKGKIAICAKKLKGDKVLISVSDTGIGIPSDHLESIFQEFIQVDRSSTRKVGGTGLGLPISRRLIEMHGGRVWVESAGISGKGSTFYVELPLEVKLTEIIKD